MIIGALTAAWAEQPLKEVLEFFEENGLKAVEIGTGNYPPNNHCDPVALNADNAALDDFIKEIKIRNLKLSALSCHGNPLHPDPAIAEAHHNVFVNTVELADKIQQRTGWQVAVNGFSGLPGGAPGDKTPNWVVAPWPEDHLAALEYQWGLAIEYWKEQNELLEKHNVNMCFEMHPNFLVYNPSTLLRLREACGPRMCANFDPSHLFWQGINPSAAIIKLERDDPFGFWGVVKNREVKTNPLVVQHVHAKDSCVNPLVANADGVLDTKHYADELNRAWIFRTVGYGHDAGVWTDIISTLAAIRYNGAVSIEHEDSLMSNNEGFLRAVTFLDGVTIEEVATEITWA